jgi:hypothetical protein
MKTIIATILIFACCFAMAQDSDFNSPERRANRESLAPYIKKIQAETAAAKAALLAGRLRQCAQEEDMEFVSQSMSNSGQSEAEFRARYAWDHPWCVADLGFKP